MSHKQIYYSDKYDDEEFEYRHVMLPKDIAKLVPKTHLMSESEWRNLGVQQSQGWVHYMIHEPARCWQLMPVILTTSEAEIETIIVQGHPKQIVPKTPSPK
uniref:Cyclin-dependent kinases regulatory subunit n=1 Tax=Castor canadensis TaxID=51338 RepID=A0A8B7US34_CASCN|nr:cyclin-dependent kinases regulatory subunit 1 isoform X1 [Castor canadensis]